MLGAALHSGCAAPKDLLKSSYILILITIQDPFAFMRTLLYKHGQLNHWPINLHPYSPLWRCESIESSNLLKPLATKSVFKLLKNTVSNHILKIQKEKNKHFLL